MGSALCFPTECIIFSAIIEYASREYCTRTRTSPKLWSVYGDDLIVPREIYSRVIEILARCGFRVNETKSYNSGPYRESCGKDYYAGHDVSALYYRTPFYNHKVSPSAYGSWCSSANNAKLHRLPLYRWYLITKILSAQRRSGPYFDYSPELSPHLYSPQPTNFHVRKRWNRAYQRWDGKFTVVKSRPRGSEPDDDNLCYFIRLVEMSRRRTSTKGYLDESPTSVALHGSVEFFSSTVLPIVPYKKPNKLLAVDW
jgi:hypothetical protein